MDLSCPRPWASNLVNEDAPGRSRRQSPFAMPTIDAMNQESVQVQKLSVTATIWSLSE
jgi:hypothetical protein